MWKLDYKESWAPKNWCFWTVVLEKTLESPLDCKEIQPIHPQGNQSWIFTDAEAETPILWPPDAKNWLTGKDPDVVKDWRQENVMTEDEMVGWHHQLSIELSKQTCVWVSSGSWWWAGKPGMLQFMGSQRVTHGWATELNWEEDIEEASFYLFAAIYLTCYQNHKQQKQNKLALHQTSLCIAREITDKVKRPPIEWVKIFQTRGIFPKFVRDCHNSRAKTQITWF